MKKYGYKPSNSEYTILEISTRQAHCLDNLCWRYDYHRRWHGRNITTPKAIGDQIRNEEPRRTQIFFGYRSCQIKVRYISIPTKIYPRFIIRSGITGMQAGWDTYCLKPQAWGILEPDTGKQGEVSKVSREAYLSLAYSPWNCLHCEHCKPIHALSKQGTHGCCN